MKKVISLILALVLCLSLCACGSGSNRPSMEEIAGDVQKVMELEAYAECTREFSDVVKVVATVRLLHDNGDDTYDVKGYATILSKSGKQYTANFTATVEVDDMGEIYTKSFNMSPPQKK